MKKIIFVVLIAAICLAFKNRSFLTDYRDAYVGTYACKYYQGKLSSETNNYIQTTGNASISLSKDAMDSIMQISFNGLVVKAKLINGGLLQYPTGRQYGGRFFATDSISFFYIPTRAFSIRYMGKK